MQPNSAYPGIFTFSAGVLAGGVYPAMQILPGVGATMMGWTDLLIIVTPTTHLPSLLLSAFCGMSKAGDRNDQGRVPSNLRTPSMQKHPPAKEC
ncbi:hypothetical protein DEM27_28780 [Metarhizobium album]|uniref:Uncharacterized protein n=1 Tax=Metarhizobium album TaxID=2182425 RepID=A0A2U2DHM2_9HYPH|nr:hypothetical protein DEM27_28780 [Rhizobium album]